MAGNVRARGSEAAAGHARTGSGTSCSSATRPRARRPWSRRCSSGPAPSAGPAGRGRHHGQRPRGRRAPAGSVGVPGSVASVVHPGGEDQLRRHPGARRLRRRGAGGAEGGGCRPLRRLGGGRRRRHHPDALGGVRRRRDAARGRRHPSRPAARRLRRARSRSASGSSATASSRSTCRCSTTTRLPAGLIGLLSQQVFDYSSRHHERSAPPDPEHVDAIAGARATLIEGIIQESEDDSLLDRWLGRRGRLVRHPRRATSRPRSPAARSTPCCRPTRSPGSASTAVARGDRPRVPVAAGAPGAGRVHPGGAPREPISCDPGGPLVAEVVKTTTDPYVGRREHRAGLLRHPRCPDATVHVSGHFEQFAGAGPRPPRPRRRRAGRRGVLDPRRDAHPDVARAIAGDIVAVARLTRAETGDTLSDLDGAPALMEPWVMPEPLLPTAVTAKTSADEDKLSQGLSRLVAEDPTVRVEVNPDTHQMVLWSMGEAHLEVLLDRLRDGSTASRSTPSRSRSPCARPSPSRRPATVGT